VKGELDWIVMKTLEKDRNRRYETVKDFAADMQRYLNDEPVQACPPSAWYRFRKFTRRRRQAVVVALALCLGVLATVVALATSTILIARERAEAVHQKKQAEENFRMAKEAIDSFYTKVSESDLFDQPGAQLLRKQLLEDARKFYEHILQQEQQDGAPNLRAELAATHFRLWQIYQATNRFTDGLAALRKGVEIAEQLPRNNPNDVELYKRVASFRLGGQFFHVEFVCPPGAGLDPTFQKAANFWASLVQRYPREPDFQLALAELYGQLANLWRQDGSPPGRALALHEKRIDLCQKVARANPTVLEYQERLANARVYHGLYLKGVGRFEEGEKSIRQGLDFAQRVSAQFPTTVRHRVLIARAHQSLGYLYMAARRSEEALKAFSRARDCFERLLSEFPKSLGYLRVIASCHGNPVYILLDAGKLRDAEIEARQTIALDERVVAAFPGEVYELELADAHLRLGQVLSAAGRSNEAVPAFRDAVAVYEKLDPTRIPMDPDWMKYSSNCYQHLVNALKAKGEDRETVQAVRSAIAFYEKLASEHCDPAVQTEVAKWHLALSQLRREGVTHQEAEESRAKALASGKKALAHHAASDQDRWVLTMSQRELAQAFRADPRLAKEAEELYRQAMTILEKLAADNPTIPNFRVDAGHTARSLGSLLRDMNRPAEAEKAFRQAIAFWEKLAVESPGDFEHSACVGYGSRDLGWLLMSARRFDEAAQAFKNALEQFEPLVRDHPENSGYLLHVGDTLVHMGHALKAASRPQEAEQAYRQAVVAQSELVSKFPQTPGHRSYLGWAYDALAAFLSEQNRPAEAEAAYRKCVEIAEKGATVFPNDANLAGLAGRFAADFYTALNQSGKYREAAEGCTKALVKWPNNAPLRVSRGRAYLALGQPAKALDDFTQAIELAPGDGAAPWWHLQRSFAYAALKQDDKALAELTQATETWPKLWDTWVWRGSYYRDRQQWAKAIADYSRALALNPAYKPGWQLQGVCQYRSGDWQDAVVSFTKSTELSKGGDAFGWFYLAMAHWQMGRRDEARKWFNKAVEWMDKNQPKNEELRRFRAEAAELLGIEKKKD
jgi:tetratricopeptide (TPR) repeat protein